MRAVERHAAHVEVHDQHGLRVEAQRDLLHVAQAAHEESRADQQHDRQRGLHEEQHAAQPRVLVRTLPRAGLEVGGQI